MTDTAVIETLTVDQLLQAAADLRNSSLVMAHLGRCTGHLVDDEGLVCSVGAVELATTKRLVQRANTKVRWFSVDVLITDDLDSRLYRAKNALTVLASVIPVQLCASCDDAGMAEHLTHGRTCPICYGVYAARDPWDTVTHFNDNHAVGDAGTELLHGLFELGAERAMTTAADKRSLVGGRLLASV